VAFSSSLFNWIADVACLAFAAYAAARAVGSIPLMPGGLLVVEAVLVPGLVSSGMTLDGRDFRDADLPAGELDFISAIGWVVFFFMFRTRRTSTRTQDSTRSTSLKRSAMPSPNTTHRSATCRPEPAPSSQFSSQSL
jgi:putative heme transporter